MPEQRIKKYVEVIADFSPEGIPDTSNSHLGHRPEIRHHLYLGGAATQILKDWWCWGTLYLPNRKSQNISVL